MTAPRRIEWRRRAEKELTKLSRRDAARMQSAIERVARGDLRGLRVLVASDPVQHRLRAGHWRVILEFDRGTATVVRVLHRSKVYTKADGFRQAVPSDLGLPEYGTEESLDELMDAGDVWPSAE